MEVSDGILNVATQAHSAAASAIFLSTSKSPRELPSPMVPRVSLRPNLLASSATL